MQWNISHAVTVKAVRLFAELETKSGAGLIERRKVGQGHPTKILREKLCHKTGTPHFRKWEV